MSIAIEVLLLSDAAPGSFPAAKQRTCYCLSTGLFQISSFLVTLCTSQNPLLVSPLELFSDEHNLLRLMRPGGEDEGRVVSSASVTQETPCV